MIRQGIRSAERRKEAWMSRQGCLRKSRLEQDVPSGTVHEADDRSEGTACGTRTPERSIHSPTSAIQLQTTYCTGNSQHSGITQLCSHRQLTERY